MTDETSPPQERAPAKQGAAIGGWICFGLGALIMYGSVWAFILYVPLFSVAFILSIVAMAQRRIVLGIVLLLATILVPLIEWLTLATTRTNKFLDEHGVPKVNAFNRKSESPPVLSRPFANTPGVQQPQTMATSKSIAASAPDPVSQIYADGLNHADASEIVIALSKPLHVNIIGPAPIFSPDGKKLLLGAQQPGGSGQLLITDLETLRTERTIIPKFSCEKLAWSPDGKRILYQDGGGSLHIVDIDKGSEVALPVSGGTLASYDRQPVWRTDDTVTFVVDRSGTRWIDDLSLDDLKLRRRTISDGEMNKEFQRMFGTGREHPYAWVYQGEAYELKDNPAIGYFSTTLMVGNRDGSYAHLLLPRFYSSTSLYPSSNLRHLLVIENGSARMLYLGVRPKPPMAFKIDLGISDISSNSKTDFDLFRKLKVPFRADVYALATNPLNGKQIGPDTSRFKGRLEVVRWENDHVICRPTLEIEPFGEGDVAANIRSDSESQHFGNRNFNFGDDWRVLRVVNKRESTSSDNPESAAQDKRSTGLHDAHEAPAQSTSANLAGERFPETKLRSLDSLEVQDWSEAKLRYAINELFARHGALFSDKAISTLFSQFQWYHPDPTLTLDQIEMSFSDIEKQNLKLLGECRDAKRAVLGQRQRR